MKVAAGYFTSGVSSLDDVADADTLSLSTALQTHRHNPPMAAVLTASFMSNVNNIYRRRHTSNVRIGGAGGRRNVRPCRMQQRTVQYSDVP